MSDSPGIPEGSPWWVAAAIGFATALALLAPKLGDLLSKWGKARAEAIKARAEAEEVDNRHQDQLVARLFQMVDDLGEQVRALRQEADECRAHRTLIQQELNGLKIEMARKGHREPKDDRPTR